MFHVPTRMIHRNGRLVSWILLPSRVSLVSSRVSLVSWILLPSRTSLVSRIPMPRSVVIVVSRIGRRGHSSVSASAIGRRGHASVSPPAPLHMPLYPLPPALHLVVYMASCTAHRSSHRYVHRDTAFTEAIRQKIRVSAALYFSSDRSTSCAPIILASSVTVPILAPVLIPPETLPEPPGPPCSLSSFSHLLPFLPSLTPFLPPFLPFFNFLLSFRPSSTFLPSFLQGHGGGFEAKTGGRPTSYESNYIRYKNLPYFIRCK